MEAAVFIERCVFIGGPADCNHQELWCVWFQRAHATLRRSQRDWWAASLKLQGCWTEAVCWATWRWACAVHYLHSTSKGKWPQTPQNAWWIKNLDLRTDPVWNKLGCLKRGESIFRVKHESNGNMPLSNGTSVQITVGNTSWKEFCSTQALKCIFITTGEPWRQRSISNLNQSDARAPPRGRQLLLHHQPWGRKSKTVN